MPVVSASAWGARRGSSGGYVPFAPTYAGRDPRMPAAPYYTEDQNTNQLPPYAAAPEAVASSVRPSRCPLQDISNMAARFAAGGKSDAKAPVNGLPPAAAVPAAVDPFGAQADTDGAEAASEYVPSIFGELFRKEALAMAPANYMDWQAEINPKMRAILIDWLVDVQAKYKMRSETLFLTVNLIDRYLARVQVSRRRLQLVGVVAMFIAAKFEELDAPLAESLVYITDNAYTKKEIFDLECRFLAALDFSVLVPTAAHFLERLQRTNHSDGFHQELARYILELGLLEHGTLQHEPSRMAAAAVLLSNELMCRLPAWPAPVARVARWSQASLGACAGELRGLLERAPQQSLQAVRKKYSEQKHSEVAKSVFLGSAARAPPPPPF